MAKIYGINGQPLDEPERTRPEVAVDTEEGRFIIPVTALLGGQYESLVKEITGNILSEVLPLLQELLGLNPGESHDPDQLELPLGVAKTA